MSVIKKTKILLPNESVSLYNYAVVACDQFTSNAEYWDEVARLAEGVPSAAHYILPEIYLETRWEHERLEQLPSRTAEYLEEVLTRSVDGAIAVERKLADGSVRLGLVVAIDLEQYAFDGSQVAILPTENTIVSRIPARCEARRRSSLECPHILMLLDNAERDIIEPLFDLSLPLVYDTPLQQGGGSIKGFAVEDDATLELLSKAITKLYVGDGNHSLAAAKTLYEEKKQQLGDAAVDHPSRYCLVEIINLYSEALPVLPIHRVIFGVSEEQFMFTAKKILTPGDARLEVYIGDAARKIAYDSQEYSLAVLATDAVCEAVLMEYDGSSVDYIHGDEELKEFAKQGVGLLMPYPKKSELIPYIEKNGVFPKKYFSLGHGPDKRYYLECRKIVK